MNKVLFKESQQFRQWWQVVFILVATVPSMILLVYALFQQMVMGVQVGNSPAPNGIMIAVFIGLCILLWILFSLKLEVWIDQQGIHYRFFPLILKSKLIAKEEILRFEIRKYKPLLEYGGWGIRRGVWNKWGRAYCVEGNTGLQLYLRDGKKVLFGTQRPQSIQGAMSEIVEPK
ncbi:MAG: hypothetical protein ACM3O8_04250 [Methylococcaceae bacterium]|nr:hypothetical protein [Prolixibacteraceae bacterium]